MRVWPRWAFVFGRSRRKMQRPRISAVAGEAEVEGLPVVRARVAGADLASEVHWVCAPTVDGTGREVEKFGATTPELERIAAWLKERKVESVAMESTGVYWRKFWSSMVWKWYW